MQAIYRLLRKIVIVTHIFSDVPQLNITNFSQLSLKDLSVALLFITFFVVQFSRCNVVNTSSASLAAPQAARLILFAVSPLRATNAFAGLCRESEPDGSGLLLKPDRNVQHSCALPSILNSKLVEIVGIEPATSCLQGRRSPS